MIDNWKIFAVLGAFFFVAFIGLIVKEFHKNKRIKKWRDALFFCFTFIGLSSLVLVVASFFWRTVTFGTNGNISSFGQSGDFFGGVLNPILGFITVLLLLRTATLQRQQLINEKNVRHLASLENVLESSLKHFETLIKATKLKDADGTIFHLSSMRTAEGYSTTRRDLICDIAEFLRNGDWGNKNVTHPPMFSENFYPINVCRESFFKIVDHYKSIMELQEFDIPREEIASNLRNFSMKATTMGLVAVSESHEIFLLTVDQNNLK